MGVFDWFSRGGRVARGKANAVMDSIEDATFETTLKQTIADMKGDLRKLVNASADAMANGTRLQRQHDKLIGQSEEWKGKAKAALQGGREDLAKRALAKRAEFDRDAATLKPQVEAALKSSETIKERIEQLKARITEAERTSATLVARKNAAAAQKKVAAAIADLGDQDNAFSTLKRFEETVEKQEAAALAFDELAGATAGSSDRDLDKEIALLGLGGGSSGVDDDLAALKAELEG
ncbi:MAG: PspA/IM30 family protein [Planctomycetes bacterium]|nr:PspA/IM30 family protein [Planctomycetota bacterium]